MYTKKQFGHELKEQLEKGYDVQGISTWADNAFFNHQRDLEEGLEDYIMPVQMMGMGPEFVISKNELLRMVDKLVVARN